MLEKLKVRLRYQLSKYPRIRAMVRAARRPLWYLGRHHEPGRHWDGVVGKVEGAVPQGWLDWEIIEREYIRPQVAGDEQVYYLSHFIDSHLERLPVERALSLGCGGGNLERSLLELGVAENVDGVDASEESIRLADELAREAGLEERLHYRVEDINHFELPTNAYDFVVIKMALHHFERLEHVYDQLRGALKPNGLLMFNEYVGPSRHQWTDLQLELMNRMLELLPKKIRQRGVAKLERPTVEHMLAVDPTESVRSAEILPLLEERFEIVEHKPYGGTLLHVLLSEVMAGFDLDDENQLALLRMLFLYEKTLIEQGVLPSDFAYVVARPLKG